MLKFEYLNENKKRLDHFLDEQIKDVTRSQIQKLIKTSKVWVNEKNEKSSYTLELGDQVEVDLEDHKTQAELYPVDLKLRVLFEDEYLAVIFKPHNLSVHPGNGPEQVTLAHGLLHQFSSLSTGFKPDRPGLVHRLDKDTEGLLVVAKTDEVQEGLKLQFQSRQAGRTYLALAWGDPKNSKGSFETHLSRHPRQRLKRASVDIEKYPKAKKAITHYDVLAHGPVSLWNLKLETGRTHQIRVHLSENLYPIVNDTLYGPQNTSHLKGEMKALTKKLGRICLIAYKLEFVHPKTQKPIKIDLELPPYWKGVLKKLKPQFRFVYDDEFNKLF